MMDNDKAEGNIQPGSMLIGWAVSAGLVRLSAFGVWLIHKFVIPVW